MASRTSTYREEISSVSSVGMLPPITVQRADNRTDESVTPIHEHDHISRSEHMLSVPSLTPDSKYESGEFQKRLGSPDCLQCQWEKEKREKAASKKKNEKANLKKKEQEKIKEDVIKVPYALPEVSNDIVDKLPPKHHNKQKVIEQQKDFMKSKVSSGKASLRSTELHSSRSYFKLPEHKNKRLYNSWEGGLHKYHVEDSDSDEDPLIFRFRLKDKIEDGSKKKQPKTPPKSPFRGAVLAEIENRRSVKVKEAHEFSSHVQPVKGKPVLEELSDQQVHRHNVPKEPEFMGKLRQIPPKKEYWEGMEKGSQIFQKKSSKEKITRPFLPAVEERPQVAKGRTIIRNPLAPVSIQQRVKPVVVLKSKLDDYSEAIREFLECIIEEQKRSFEGKKPASLDQSSENMVIYKDFDEIQHMKDMARAMKLGFQTLNNQSSKNQFNFKSQGLAKGKSNIKKIGALDPGGDGYRFRTPKKMSVGGQSVFVNAAPSTFITEPNKEDIETVAADNNPYESMSEPKEHSSKYTLYGSKTTMVPPNTPYERVRLTAVGTEGQ